MEKNYFKTITIEGTNIDITLYNHPNECPYCHKHIIPKYISYYLENFEHYAFATLLCTNIECDTPFIARYTHEEEVDYYYDKLVKHDFIKESFPNDIDATSPMFCQIYNEAYFAEQNGLLEICGVGYRKSLEFLIKDYLIILNPDKEEQIKKNSISNCISSFVKDTRIKSVASRAIWLGNDHTHYEKKWNDKDLADLKTLIKLTISWIELEILSKRFIDSMQ